MENMSIPADAYLDMLNKINLIIENQQQQNTNPHPLSDVWLDIQETAQLLKVSKRTLQSYRDNGVLSFSQIGGKIYFKASDIEDHLKKHYVKAFAPKKK
ncbi:MAG TPA: helix-turn-helix domain-containing protein [Bacteroidales bacterium]|nr:helix-turn-helix domain-containing protein [Bacteroidales bacterium]